ncbi:NAD-dependent epimerase/dehydratase family protein [Candidatus Micrarchaeota archaeon]|nr:NAD-dependent epimerase/dehydratase family protein [Candidatus Micrarchaeota archaeon]
MFENKAVVVTGAAGFIASHVVDELLSKGSQIIAIDNMRTGQPKIVQEHKKHKNYKFVKEDLLHRDKIISLCKGADFIFHLAANADIRGGIKDTQIDLEQNVIATHNVLEAMRINDIKGLVFSSSAAVYGTQKTFPTPEDAPKVQTSLYGASKLAAESLIEAYSEYYGTQSSIYRFVSVVGERYPHGVVIDFYRKLRKDPKNLEILGDGKQKKSFMYIKDCVAGMMFGASAAKPAGQSSQVFNLGQNYTIEITKVADMIVEEMNLTNVKYHYTGGSVGWVGDQPIVHLSTKKIEALGWSPKTKIEDGIRKTIRYLIDNGVA